MRLYGPINSGAATGGAGVATANLTATVPVVGKLYGVYIRYNDSPPATTDVTIATGGTYMPAVTLLTVSDAAADGVFLPRKAVVDLAGAAFASQSVAACLPINDTIKVTIAQANNGDSVDVWLYLE